MPNNRQAPSGFDERKAIVGDTVTFGCGASSQNGAAWKFNGLAVNVDGNQVTISRNGELTIRNVQPAYSGVYTCEKWNGQVQARHTLDVTG